MKPIVEDLVVRKNNFVKWLNLTIAFIFLLGIFFIKNDPWKNQWYALGGGLLFGGIYLHYAKYKISTTPDGFTIHSLHKPTFNLWKEISAINYIAKTGKSVELILQITYGDLSKDLKISAKQFRKKEIQRFFEMLNEQCNYATKNDFFLKQVAGALTWKDQLKMLR